MPKIWQPGKRGARDLNSYITQNGGEGTALYTVIQQADFAVWNPARMYSEHIIDGRSLITGQWMVGHLSIEGLLAQEGKVYAAPPRNMRNMADPAPQVRAPLGTNDYEGILDEAELRGLDKRVRSGSDPATRQPIRGRGRR